MASRLIKDAASIIIASKGTAAAAARKASASSWEDYNIVMLERSSRSSFMPSACVFPGGGREEADGASSWVEVFASCGVTPASLRQHFRLPDKIRAPIYARLDGKRDNNNNNRIDDKCSLLPELALRLTALRETFEETGLLLAVAIQNGGHHQPIAITERKTFLIGRENKTTTNGRGNGSNEYYNKALNNIQLLKLNSKNCSTSKVQNGGDNIKNGGAKTNYSKIGVAFNASDGFGNTTDGNATGLSMDTTDIIDVLEGRSLSEWRTRISGDAGKFVDLFAAFNNNNNEVQLLPWVWGLTEWWGWLTPSSYPKKRFDTVFYTALLHDVPLTEHWLSYSGESDSLKVLAPSEAVKSWLSGKIMLAPPQVYELGRLRHYRLMQQLQQLVNNRVLASATEATDAATVGHDTIRSSGADTSVTSATVSSTAAAAAVDTWVPQMYELKDGSVSVLPGDALYGDHYDVVSPGYMPSLDLTIKQFRYLTIPELLRHQEMGHCGDKEDKEMGGNKCPGKFVEVPFSVGFRYSTMKRKEKKVEDRSADDNSEKVSGNSSRETATCKRGEENVDMLHNTGVGTNSVGNTFDKKSNGDNVGDLDSNGVGSRRTTFDKSNYGTGSAVDSGGGLSRNNLGNSFDRRSVGDGSPDVASEGDGSWNGPEDEVLSVVLHHNRFEVTGYDRCSILVNVEPRFGQVVPVNIGED